MDARPLLERVARAFQDARLDAVMIGNAAAALRGAPVTTTDFDFMIRKTPGNVRKLKKVAEELGATLLTPYYPVSDLYRLENDDLGLQIDFMPTIHGIRSFEALRSRATTIDVGGAALRVAALGDIIKSKRAAARPRDVAVLPVLEATLDESSKTRK